MHKISKNLSSHISKLLVITDKIHSCNMRHTVIQRKSTYCLVRTHLKPQNHYTTMMQSYGMKFQNQLKKIQERTI